jgi:hypothetical protein
VSNVAEPTPTSGAAVETDLLSALQHVFQNSEEPLTLSKIRAKLPTRLREVGLEELGSVLNRQVAAQVLYAFPKYRSQQDRYWDRAMPVHIAALLRESLTEGAMGWSDLRRRLPAYAQNQAEEVLQEQVSKGKLFRHPRIGRGSERFGAAPPDPREYLRDELAEAFTRLEKLGFGKEQLRAAALEMLHDEEWASTPPATEPRGPAGLPEDSPSGLAQDEKTPSPME